MMSEFGGQSTIPVSYETRCTKVAGTSERYLFTGYKNVDFIKFYRKNTRIPGVAILFSIGYGLLKSSHLKLNSQMMARRFFF